MRLKYNAPNWEEVRERIIKAIEEDKRTKSQISILTASAGIYPPLTEHKMAYLGSTANEDVCEITKDILLATPSAF